MNVIAQTLGVLELAMLTVRMDSHYAELTTLITTKSILSSSAALRMGSQGLRMLNVYSVAKSVVSILLSLLEGY